MEKMMVSGFYASLLAILFIFLSIKVISNRRHLKIALGDDNNPHMRNLIRAHGNCAEYTPFFLVMLGFAEHGRLPAYGLHTLGFIFLLSRILHAYAIIQSRGRYRIIGMAGTFTALSTLSIILSVQYLMYPV